jgi:two-component system copper resistance phosphate regulon response regulator CusR
MRIAFAEDDAQLRTAVVRGLREASYAVDQAETGSEALDLVSRREYDAIILDILIPAPDGIEVCKTIRASGSRVPILMLTALDSVEQRITGLDSGADDYLTKPFDFGELLARLRALTRRHGEAMTAPVTVGDLSIDTRRHVVKRKGKIIPLTAKEYTLLLYLANHSGRVISRAELMTHVWNDVENAYTNIIDVYASRLRRKIDGGADTPLISTVRGAGFMLALPENDGTQGQGPRSRGM